MAKIYISIGSNINRDANIRGGVAALRQQFQQVELSHIYESSAVGFSGDPFYNLVARAQTDLAIDQVVQVLHDIEDQFGRERGGPRFSSRTLDMDLLLYDDVVTDTGRCRLPRDEITRNAFVLWPLAEIAPTECHPVLGQSYAELWRDFDRSDQLIEPIDYQW